MKTLLSAILVWLVGTTCIWAQQPAQNDDEETARLTKAVQNPVANLTTLPFQNNLNYPIGDFNRYQNVMNIQPVIPFGIGQWNLITRSILPVIDQGDVTRPDGSRAGLGDLSLSFLHVTRETRKANLGCRTCFSDSDSYCKCARHRQVECGPHGCCAGATGALDYRSPGKQCMVVCWTGLALSRQCVLVATFHQLQFGKGLVHHHLADHHV
jgi:hypothetical protein